MTIPAPKADSLLRTLIHRAEASRPVLDFFAEMTGEILYDPNSPLRNDEYYIPILEELAKSPLYDEYDKMIPQHTLKIVKQNRVRSVANDFRYTLADGTQHSLHSIKADYTILLFNNPGCETCREVIDQIEHSEKLKELSAKHSIVTLAIYPDEDIEAWHDYLPSMPQGWICGYDQGMVLTNDKLYDLKAIPSLYLLDRAKHVLVKDGMSIEQVEQIISQGIQL
jgi:thiol-disulfide isomerase/thioredoxin